MEERPHYVAAKAFLQTLWSEVQWKAKRDPSSDNFDELDMFVERHKAFFDAKILEPFSYEKLFEQHFPCCYERTKHRVKNWRENFLATCEEAYIDNVSLYKDDEFDSEGNQKTRQLFLAVKNNDEDTVRHLIKTGQLIRANLDDHYRTPFYDRVEEQSLITCLRNAYSQAVAKIIFEELIAPPLRARENTNLMEYTAPIQTTEMSEDEIETLVLKAKEAQRAPKKPALFDEDLLCEAIQTHQSLSVIQQCCEKVDMTHMLSDKCSWVEYACFSDYPEAGLYFVQKYSLPLTVPAIRGMCSGGKLDALKVAMEQFKSFDQEEYKDFIRAALYKDHDTVVKYLIENAEKFNFTLKAEDFKGWIEEACAAGKFNLVTYLFERVTFDPDDLDRLLDRAVSGMKNREDDDLRVINFLLENGSAFESFLYKLSGPHKEMIIKKLIEEFRPESVKAFYRKELHEEAEKLAEEPDDDPELYAIRVMLNALDNPTSENIAALNSERMRDPVNGSTTLLAMYENVVQPFVSSPTPVVEKQKHEEHLSKAETLIDNFLEQEKLEHVTTKSIDSMSLNDFIKWEWAELLRHAMRNSTTASWDAVHAFKAKYEARDEQGFGYDEELIEKCNGLYEKCKAYETSPLMVPTAKGMTRDVLSHVFFKLSDADRKAVRAVSRTHKAAIDNLDEKTFAYMYPIEYQKIIFEKREKIDWKAELKRAEKLLSTKPYNQLEALFRAIRDPSRDIQAVREIAMSIDFGVGGNSLANKFDALENITLFQCARQIGFKEALVAIFEEIRRTCKDNMSDFLAAIRCYQSIEVLESCYALLDSNADDFKQECRQVCVAAVESDNVEAVQFLVGRRIMGEKLIDINGVDNSGRTLLSRACDKGWVDIAWYLIAQGANLDSLAHPQQIILIGWTFEHRNEEYQRKARTILGDRVLAEMRAFSISAEDPPTLVVDDDMSHAELVKKKQAHAEKLERYEAKEKLNEHNRPISLAAQALLKVLRDPQSVEFQEELKKHEKQLEGEELKSLYELCKPFLQTPQLLSDEVPHVPTLPRK